MVSEVLLVPVVSLMPLVSQVLVASWCLWCLWCAPGTPGACGVPGPVVSLGLWQTFQLTRISRVSPGFCINHPLTRIE